MKILLCYSKDHFDPSVSPDDIKTWGISANLDAREFFTILSKIGDVTYSDGYDYEKHIGEKYDLFVGIYRNFHKILEVCDIKTSILFAVNMYPKDCNTILNNFVESELGDKRAITRGDVVDEDDIGRSIDKADYILLRGNISTMNSYLMHGVPRAKMKTFNSRLLEPVKPISKPRATKKFLYCASAVGLRKGYDIIDSLCRSIQDQDFHLDIVGKPSNQYYEQKINRLVKSLNGRVTFHGYVPVRSRRYENLYKANDFFIFPSLEEGQAGTVVEALYYGLVPLVTPESGTDYSPLGFLEGHLNSPLNKRVLTRALSLTLKETANLKAKTQEYYSELHTNYANDLEEAILNCLNGSLWPKVSFVIPIYNKAPSIKELVVLADNAAKEYGNAEAHIIFDGCSDSSEEIVKNYYKNRDDYAVKFYTTPNIFEVKSNNLGLRNSTGKYSVILQDDNYIYDKYYLYEGVQFLDKNPTGVIVGGLGGVNFYPLATRGLEGSGDISINEREVYWRQNEDTDPDLKNKIFEVDACMRGPLFFRKSFLEKYGYLDEAYAPLHQDDMDICFRAKKHGFKSYGILMDVANKSLTTAHYDGEKAKFFAETMRRNLKLFYSRWTPSVEKDYLWINRIPLWRESPKLRPSAKNLLGKAVHRYNKTRFKQKD